jgi:hypothetical protein
MGWNSAGPLDGFIQILAFEYVVAGELFLGFGKWPIDRHWQPILNSDCGRRPRRFQFFAAEQDAFLSRIGHDRSVPVHNPTQFFGRKWLIGLM